MALDVSADVGVRDEHAAARAGAQLLSIVRDMAAELGHAAPSSIGLDSALDSDLGIDSLGRVELLLRMQRALHVSLPDEIALGARTPRALLDAMFRSVDGTMSVSGPDPVALDEEPPDIGAPAAARTLTEALEWHAAQHGDRVTVQLLTSDGVRAISYRELYERARTVAAHLVATGVAPQERVAIMLPTSEEYFFSFLGVLMAGAVPVPIYPPLRADLFDDHLARHSAILRNAAVSVLIAAAGVRVPIDGLRSKVETLRHVMSADRLNDSIPVSSLPSAAGRDIALIQYTSGSTGDPKGVVLTHDNLLANIRGIQKAMSVTSQDVVVSWLPLYHDMGLIASWLGAMYVGCRLVIMPPTSFIARPQRWLRAIHDHRATISAAPNFAYELCASKLDESMIHGLDLSSWRLALNGSEPVNPKTLERFSKRFQRYGFVQTAFMPVFGLAENAVALTVPSPGRPPRVDRVDRRILEAERQAFPADGDHTDSVEIVSCGRALPGHDVRIVDEHGTVKPNRKVGLVQFRGPSACAGYFGNPEATAVLYDGDWLHSGDYGYIAEGELYISGRAKDLIIRAGRHIFPQELEAAVGLIAGVRHGSVAVFGQPDADTGVERVIVVAETRLTDPTGHQALRQHIQEAAMRILGITADDVVLARPRSIPKTSSGKIRRRRCREVYESQQLELSSRKRTPPVHASSHGIAAHAWRRLQEYAYTGYCHLIFHPMKLCTFIAMAIVPTVPSRRLALKAIGRFTLRAMRIRLRVAGTEHLVAHQPCIAVVNHQGYLDTLIMNVVVPPSFFFTAKRDLENDPVRAWLLRRLDVQFVDRLNPQVGVADLKLVGDRIRHGQSAVVYPEGIFFDEPGLTRFFMGAFTVAAETNVPIVPVAVRGARSILRGEKFFFRRGSIDVTVSPPVLPNGQDWSAAVSLRQQARRAILTHCGEADLT